MIHLRSLRLPGLLTTLALSLLTLSTLGSGTAFAATHADTSQTTCLSTYTTQYQARDWVITAFPYGWIPGCGINPFDQVVTIAPPPTTTTTICVDPPLPSPFLLIAQGSSSQCNGATQTILPLSQSTPSVTVCASSPIPSGWITLGESRSTVAASTCSVDAKTPNTPIQRTIAPVPAGTTALTVCADSAIPPGFTNIAVQPNPDCHLDGGHSLFLTVSPVTD